MRNAFAILTALCVASAVGCSHSTTPAPVAVVKKPNPNPTDQNQGSLTWNLKFESKCSEAVASEDCVAQYGFSVQLPEGQFKVGPTPTGETRSGSLSAEELKALTAALGGTLSQATLGAEGRATLGETETQDTLFLTKGAGNADVLVKTEGGDLVFKTKDAEEAKFLLSTVRALAVKYYQIPFPDACADGASVLEGLFAPLQTCTIDTDCSYVDSSFDLIELASASYVYTDECKMVRPMVVGNASAIRSNLEKLQSAAASVANACGDRFFRADCSLAGFEPNGKAPVCQAGVCQANAPASVLLR